MLGRGYKSYFSEYPLSSTLSKYITLNAFVLMEYNAAFLYANVDFHFFNDVAADIQIWALLDKKSM